MLRNVHLTGCLPENALAALAELKQDLGMIPSETGLVIHCQKGGALTVESDGAAVSLTWASPVEFYRGLSLIPDPIAPCAIHEKARFETVGVMFDCSRNAVLKPEALRFFFRKMALMGLNMGI